MKTYGKPTLRRQRPVRVATGNRAPKDAAKRPRFGQRHQVHAERAAASVPRTATGVLVPRLCPTIPTAFDSGKSKGLPSLVKELIELGGLKPESVGKDINDLIETGFVAICPEGILSIEGATGYDPTLFINEGGLYLDIHQNCHHWKVSLEPIVTRLSGELLADFIETLNASVVQGPWFWDEMIGWSNQSAYEGDEDEEKERPTDDPHPPHDDGEAWLKELREKHPEVSTKPKREQLLTIQRAEPAPEELVVLVRNFIATKKAAEPFTGSHALAVACWNNNDCMINHAHDAILASINRGHWDEETGEPFEIHGQSMTEIKQAMDVVGAFIEALVALDLWSHKKLKEANANATR